MTIIIKGIGFGPPLQVEQNCLSPVTERTTTKLYLIAKLTITGLLT